MIVLLLPAIVAALAGPFPATSFPTVTTSQLARSTTDVCQIAPFDSLACLSDNAAAASFCSAAAPVRTVTTTTISWVTAVASGNARSQATVTDTNAESTTITVTAGSDATVTSISTQTDSFSTTITTYVSSAAFIAPVKRNHLQRFHRRQASTCDTSSALSCLSSLPGSDLSTACACAGQTVPTASGTIVTITTGVPFTTTLNAGLAPTSTVFALARLTYTLTVTSGASTVVISTTTSVTSTSTLSLAAPTFTQVYGPAAGCEDISVRPALQLNSTITGSDAANELCQGWCKQEPQCAFLYVQQMFTDYGTTLPYFMCYGNDHKLNVTADLLCGLAEGIYGTACGFNACGRGTV